MESKLRSNVSRRTVIKGALVAGIGAALSDVAFAADSPLITKAIPKSGEKLPAIGLGTNAYSVTSPEDLAARREVLEHFPKLGAKVVDTARGYGESEVVIGKLVAELGNRDQLFIATKTPIRGDLRPGDGELEDAFARLQVKKLDLLQIHNFHGIDVLFPKLQEWKQAGKVRYIGVTTSTDDQYPQIINALKTLPLDFIQVDYSIDNRGAGDEILPLAQDKGVAVLVNMPLGGRRDGNLLRKLADKKLPDFAAEFEATSWAQLLLKYDISHPAVTAVIPGTTKLTHLRDNQLAGRGHLPTAAQRKKLEEYWATV
ncbi:aryl-alcohol dehydrogenase-like predicted oxidoreductase [Povalibacter uvarum]|uniref:Aryl-alcohol dehydrogenase-like predicted oxidoreductase n=1 Tax=Povalibacter uvarum TaxID=732238 RepID=A0A841HRV3_9GAMM|nr:aldo/keto reductase [Povalibacter uvarum]MBB6095493.1 aryl-alcohol dehydrogenase-like predicted oxidoreductase [Povalibacter uvarum]